MKQLLLIFGLLILSSCQRQMADMSDDIQVVTQNSITNVGITANEEEQDVTNIIESICPDENHPHMIDLGLPSGTKWACCNINALSPVESGGYYAWGETEEKEVYDDVSYLYCEGLDPNNNGWYDGDIRWIYIGTYINGTKHDVAHVKWRDKWQMPTSGLFQELIDNCTCKWIKLKDIEGQMFISKSNGNIIFLPAAGCRLESDPPDNDGANGPWGGYWSGTRRSSDEYFAYHLYICNGNAALDFDNMWGLVMGFPIRPVMAP